jgi:hypothetical protein
MDENVPAYAEQSAQQFGYPHGGCNGKSSDREVDNNHSSELLGIH